MDVTRLDDVRASDKKICHGITCTPVQSVAETWLFQYFLSLPFSEDNIVALEQQCNNLYRNLKKGHDTIAMVLHYKEG